MFFFPGAGAHNEIQKEQERIFKFRAGAGATAIWEVLRLRVASLTLTVLPNLLKASLNKRDLLQESATIGLWCFHGLIIAKVGFLDQFVLFSSEWNDVKVGNH